MNGQTATDRIVLDVTKDGWTGGTQLGISQLDENNSGHGYRIAGPKYNGSQKALVRHTVTQRDADEIRAYLRAVYPDTKDAQTIERLIAVTRNQDATAQDFRDALYDRSTQPHGDAASDTLPAWLYQRFTKDDRTWDDLAEEDQTYWAHEAAAVRRAAARDGFKTNETTSTAS